MSEQLMNCKLELLGITNQLEREFLLWRQHKEELYMNRVEISLSKAIIHAQDLNKTLPEGLDNCRRESVFKLFGETAGYNQVMDTRFMTVGFGWATQSKVSDTAFNTINNTILNVGEKSAELEDNFLFLRQAIHREASVI